MIDTTKTIREVRYNGTAIPLLGGVDNPVVVTSDAEMEACLNDNRYLGMYVKFSGESENYLNGQVYKIAQEGEVSKFYQLPTLDNEGTAVDLAQGKQLIGSNGKVITGTSENKLNQYLNKTITEVTEDDLIGVTNLDSSFSYYTKLKNVVIGNSVTNIGYNAFRGCTGLTNVTISNSVTKIDTSAFMDCSGLTNINIPDSVITIGGSTFKNCTGLTNIVIGNNVAEIGAAAFENCSKLMNITIPSNVKTIKRSAFNYCVGLTNINWNASECQAAGELDYPIFEGCTNLTTAHIGENVIRIPAYIFMNCSGLTNINISDSVTVIGGYSFVSCTGLTSIVIPNKVTSIGSCAFEGCTGLTSVTMLPTTPPTNDRPFVGCTNLVRIIVPAGCGNIYKNTSGWSGYADKIVEASN